jgi:hypothetical protein
MERLPKILCNITSKDAGKRLLWDYFDNVFSVMVYEPYGTLFFSYQQQKQQQGVLHHQQPDQQDGQPLALLREYIQASISQ